MIQKLSNGKTLEHMQIEFDIPVGDDRWTVEISPDFAEIYNAHLDDTLDHIEFGYSKLKPSDVLIEFAGADYGEGLRHHAMKMFQDDTIPKEMVTRIQIST